MEKILLLDLTTSNAPVPRTNSLLRNFPDVKYFFFSMPQTCSIEEKAHLIDYGKSFLLSQFSISAEKYISIRNLSSISDKSQMAHEFSWEIFYKFNNWVKIRSNVYDGYLKTNVSGFTGRIINFFSGDNQDVYQIALSGESLSRISKGKLKSIAKRVSPFYTYLEPDYLLPIIPPNDQQNNQKFEILSNLVSPRIGLIPDEMNTFKLKDFSEIINNWKSFFEGFFNNDQVSKIRTFDNKIYVWTGIHSADESFGIWGNFENNDEVRLFPLSDIKEIINDEKLSRYFHQYLTITKLILPN